MKTDFNQQLASITKMIHKLARDMMARNAHFGSGDFEDLVSVGMMAAWQAWGKWEPGKAQWTTFSYLVCHQQMTKHCKKSWQKAKKLEEIVDDGDFEGYNKV